MNRFLIFVAVLVWLILPLLSSCDFETVVKVDIPKAVPRLVVNSVLIADSIIRVNVTSSRHILDSDFYPPLKDATVVVRANNGIAHTLPYQEDGDEGYYGYNHGFYLDDFKAEKGVTYSVEVSANGYETVTATTFVPTTVPVTQIEKAGRAMTDNRNPSTVFWVHFQDPPHQVNFYRIKVVIVSSWTHPITGEEQRFIRLAHIDTTDPSISENHRASGYLFFKDVVFDGKQHKIPVLINDYDLHGQTNTLIFYLENLHEDFYRYLETKALQEDTEGDPFAQPVQVHNNIKNGFGIFSGYSAFGVEYQP